MKKFYSLAFVLTTTSLLVCCGPGSKPDATGGAGGSPAVVCDCATSPVTPGCESICAEKCESICAECVETQGQGRVARVCNGAPSGITIFFEEGEVHRVCDGYAHNTCHHGTLCVAISDGGMLNGTCQ